MSLPSTPRLPNDGSLSDCCNAPTNYEDLKNPASLTGWTRLYDCTKCGQACTAHAYRPEFKPIEPAAYDWGSTDVGAPGIESEVVAIPMQELFGQKLLVMFEVLPLSDRYQQLMLTEPEARAFNGFIKAVFERRQEPLRPPSPPFPPGAFCPITHPAYEATFPNASDCYTPEEILERLEDGPSYRPGDSAGDAVV